ncbi:glycosyltransferase 87 family protein [Clostridium tyrobutyricum]|uniref:glycosyltransferase 87 family protein n=1 Tax=Clostridium tyrobutyricum TaxID=1519 RepID=UPI0011CC1F4D|nr:glycosyltransferase 87 family protein [Clostridium tyrobutyricum]
MRKAFFKEHIVQIGLILILLISLFTCIYSISNYKSSTNTNKMAVNQNMPANQDKNNMRAKGNPPNFSNKNANSRNKGPQHQSNTQYQNSTQQQMNKNFGNSSNKYAPVLTLYFVLFLILFIIMYRLFINKKLKVSRRNNKKLSIVLLLCIGTLIRISLSTVMEGYSGDMMLFNNWASSAAKNFANFYSSANSSDYPPLYIYILFLIGKLTSISGLSLYYSILLKLPSIIADIGTAYLIYRLVKKYISVESGLLLSVFYIFNPAVFIDSTLWGQVDSFFALLIVISVFLICEGKAVFSSVIFTLSVLMKPQGIIFLPVLLFEIIRRRNIGLFIKCLISAIATTVVVILPFSSGQNILWIFKLYSKTISEYPYASVNGFNFYSLIGANYKQSSSILFTFSYSTLGIIAIAAITLFAGYIYIKNRNKSFAFAAALVQIAGVFTFSTGMHERYLFPALVLSILSYVYLKDKRFFTLCIGYSITVYANIYYVLFGNSGAMNSNSHSILSDGISFLNIILFIYLIKILIDTTRKNKLLNLERID